MLPSLDRNTAFSPVHCFWLGLSEDLSTFSKLSCFSNTLVCILQTHYQHSLVMDLVLDKHF